MTDLKLHSAIMVLRHTLAALIQQKLFIYIILIHYARIPHHLILFVLLCYIFFYHVYLSIVQQLVSIIISRFQSNLHQHPLPNTNCFNLPSLPCTITTTILTYY